MNRSEALSTGFISRSSSIRRFSFSEELRGFGKAFHENWPLVLSIGLFFGWLLSFPMQGPLFGALVQLENVNPVWLTTLFLFSHLIGIASGGIAGYFYKRSMVWLSSGAIVCVIISSLAGLLSTEIWWLLFILLGFFSGSANISWVNAFATSVDPKQRGRTFVMAAVLANLILYLVMILMNNRIEFKVLLETISVLPLGMAIFLIYRYRRMSVNTYAAPPEETTNLSTKPLEYWKIFPFVFAIYAVGGLMYYVIGSLAPPQSGLLSYYGLIPYILLLLLAGSLADRFGRRINAVLGAITVGIGFMLVGLLTGSFQYIVTQTFLVGGYAFLDTFTWVISGDIRSGRKTPLFFSAVLGTNILAILTGVLLAEKIDQLVSGSEILTVSLAGLFSFISLAFMIKLRETLQPDAPKMGPAAVDSLEEILQKFDFTPRESDVIKLLIAGKSTQEILDTLVIAPDTLKSHCRNIYRKAGVRNRLEFTMAVMNSTNRPLRDSNISSLSDQSE